MLASQSTTVHFHKILSSEKKKIWRVLIFIGIELLFNENSRKSQQSSFVFCAHDMSRKTAIDGTDRSFHENSWDIQVSYAAHISLNFSFEKRNSDCSHQKSIWILKLRWLDEIISNTSLCKVTWPSNVQ